MNNGGGAGCLRLQGVMTQKQIEETKAGVFLGEALYKDLRQWIERHYRESLHIVDLLDPNLLVESRTALNEPSQLLCRSAIYNFNRKSIRRKNPTHQSLGFLRPEHNLTMDHTDPKPVIFADQRSLSVSNFI